MTADPLSAREAVDRSSAADPTAPAASSDRRASSEAAKDPAVREGSGLVLDFTRSFAAPRPLVFSAWTEAERFGRWFGPHGSAVPFCELDARAGGALRFCHRLSSGEEVWVGGEYGRVEAPERLVFTAYFTDEAGRRVERPGFPPEMRIAVEFVEEPGGTRVVIRQTGLVVDQGESQGWVESLARLRAYLADA